ncbi:MULTISPECIES: TetR/AcrR family transcriptional regulator [unclassified Amycolatopsis]|uniref:TetR/AcrR family transcriptional regulator n=1 Tax=unclassified Amycolatopsis TaxID=2618356 RepID=UPI0028755A9F|nr:MULTISPECIES: TetR/AcrR family transcriptional regulator [unclassified Amycolatopsis]MDS0137845.1 TetR/AcrR family transcriptional regulator [Amycolatopsis sp. 505]MDS0144242.1 TetR/AcrR family transcriptional regulator [Amycolatopsis sp. CM201R]
MPRPAGRMGRPPTTSREQILEAARVILDRDGWEKLTIRRLAAELGVGATTLYHHVRDKDDLLIQLLEHYAGRLPRPALPDDPRDRIVAAATVMHDALAAWPQVVEVLTADDLLGEPALWMVEGIVGGALDCGCAPERAVELYRNIWYYTVGEILVRARAGRRAAEGRPRYRDSVFANLDESRFPGLAGIGERWPELTARDTYRAGLRAFVDGLLAQESK